MRPVKKSVVIIALFVLSCSLVATAALAIHYGIKKGIPCKNCNVVIIDIDLLRADSLPCYGYRRNTAPNLCKFAGQATLFKQNYSQADWTLPSMFSTITSLYPWAHGVNSIFVNRLSPAVTTMAEQFRANGYNTSFVGPVSTATINSANGGDRGFDSLVDISWEEGLKNLQRQNKPFFVHFYSVNFHLPYLLENDGDQIEDLPKPKGLPITQDEFDIASGEYIKKNYQNIFTKKAIAQRPELFDDNTPDANRRLTEYFYSQYKSPFPNDYLREAWQPVYNTYMQFIDTKNPAHAAYLRMLYDTRIKEEDAKLAGLFTLLSSPQFAANTIVVVMSDHGETFGEHGSFTHQTDPYTEINYTPLIIRIPRQKSNVIQTVTSNIDIFPTLLSLVGVPPVSQAQGVSLVPVIRGKTPTEKRYAVGAAVGTSFLTIQDAEWMLLWHQATDSAHTLELYHKPSDPTEQINLAGLPQYKDQENVLFSLLQKIRNDTNVPLAVPSVVPSWMDQKTLERLRREGYF